MAKTSNKQPIVSSRPTITQHETGRLVEALDCAGLMNCAGLADCADFALTARFLLGETKVEVWLMPVPGRLEVVLTPRGPALTRKPLVPVLRPTPLRLRLRRVLLESLILCAF